MFLFVLLALISLASGSTRVSPLGDPPGYIQAQKQIKKALETIKDNVVSMDGNIPSLNDSRRSYVEITQVVFNIAFVEAHSCVSVEYDNLYQEIVNHTLPEALSNPQKAVDDAKKFEKTLNDKTLKIQNLIHEVAKKNDLAANELIDIIVINDPKKYKSEAEVLLAAGASAAKFNEMNDIFYDVAKRMLSHRYIIKGSNELKPLIAALTNVVRLTYPTFVAC